MILTANSERNFLLVSWEELIDSKVSGIKTHPLFEVLKRVRKNKKVWMDLVYHKNQFDDEIELYLTAMTSLDLPVNKQQLDLVDKFMSDEFRERFKGYSDKTLTQLHDVRVGEVRRKFEDLLLSK